jgi:hypothetical protein
MSSDSQRRRIESVSRELGQLHKRLADERKKEADKVGKVGQTERSINKNTSASSLQSKLREIERLHRDIEQSKKKQADISRQIADKEKKKHEHEQGLMKDQLREQKAFEQKQQVALESYKRQIPREISVSVTQSMGMQDSDASKSHDVFVSHASEDKDAFVRPLVQALQDKGLDVWYDEFTLSVGDSLRRSIDKGLANSRYGIVVLSSAFFAKNWPQYELDGLVTREMASGSKVILPIWHKVSKDEVASYSPTLADKVALNTGIQSLSEIIGQLIEVVRPGDTTQSELTITESAHLSYDPDPADDTIQNEALDATSDGAGGNE